MKILPDNKRKDTGKMKRVGKKDTKQRPTPPTKTAAIESLINKLADTNEKTVKLIDSVVIKMGEGSPAPVVKVEAPIVNVPEFPEPISPQPWKRMRIKVTKRDNDRLIKETEIERVE